MSDMATGRGRRGKGGGEGEAFDPVTGEVIEAPPKRGPFGRPLRTPEEQEAARQRREALAEERRQEVELIRRLDPPLDVPEDPPVKYQLPKRVRADATWSDVLHEAPRVSGRGHEGRSRLVVRACRYDGLGMHGDSGTRDYATLHVRFIGSAGYEFRSVGCAVRRTELRDVARVLAEYADKLDAEASAALDKTCPDCGDPYGGPGAGEKCPDCTEDDEYVAAHPDELVDCPECGEPSRLDAPSCPKCGAGSKEKDAQPSTPQEKPV